MVKKYEKSSFLIDFGVQLKKIRLDKGMSQAQLAIDCDFDVSVISRIERGKVNTSIDNLRLIAEALGIEVQQLFDFM